jgi:hypothetical protein
MPKRPKKSHPIRELRVLIGKKTQPQFAAMIGIKADTLKKIENHERGLTSRVAERIHWMTGANARYLAFGRLRNAWGDEYAPGFYQHWRDGYWPQSDQIAIDKALKLAPWVEILLRAAARKNQLWIVFARLIQALNDCREDFGLSVSINKILEENPEDYEFRRPGEPVDKVTWNPSPYSFLESAWLGRYRRRWERDLARTQTSAKAIPAKQRLNQRKPRKQKKR